MSIYNKWKLDLVAIFKWDWRSPWYFLTQFLIKYKIKKKIEHKPREWRPTPINKDSYNSKINSETVQKSKKEIKKEALRLRLILERENKKKLDKKLRKYVLKVKKFLESAQLTSLKRKEKLVKLVQVSLIYVFPEVLKNLCSKLSKKFNRSIELDLIRIHYPYKNSNILVNLLALLINEIKFWKLSRKVFNEIIIKSLTKIPSQNKENFIPSYLTGLQIKIAGRLMTANIIPRKTKTKVQAGSSSPGKVNYTDFARHTSKNRRGAYTITVSSGQNFF